LRECREGRDSGTAVGEADDEDHRLLCQAVLVCVADGLGAVAGAGLVEDRS
jgi:hypothetical protein